MLITTITKQRPSKLRSQNSDTQKHDCFKIASIKAAIIPCCHIEG